MNEKFEQEIIKTIFECLEKNPIWSYEGLVLIVKGKFLQKNSFVISTNIVQIDTQVRKLIDKNCHCFINDNGDQMVSVNC